MDAAETFRYLLTNRTIPDKGISVHEFVFKTVFYKCGPSYCICRCAYDHEFLSYVSDNGDVDVGIVDTLTTAIKDGYCQHASGFTDKSYLRPTGINIYHIAAALDLEEMSQSFISGYHSGEINIQKIYSGLFWIHPFQISVVKGNALVAPLFTEDKLHPNGYDEWQWHEEITQSSEEQSNMLHVEKISLFEFCNGKRDLKIYGLLKSAEPAHCPSLPQYVPFRDRIYESLFKHNLTYMLNAFLDSVMTAFELNPYSDPDDLRYYELLADVPSIVKLAVIYNQHDIFDKSLHLLSEELTNFNENPLLSVCDRECHPLIMTCEAFNWGCNHNRVLQKDSQNIKEDHSTKHKSNFVYLYGLLTQYTNSGLQIKHAMKQLPDIRELINTPFHGTTEKYMCEGLTPLQSYVSMHSTYQSPKFMLSMDVVRTLLELGADTDTVCTKDLKIQNEAIRSTITLQAGQTLILHLCIINEDPYNKQEWRKILELLLYENVSLDMNKTVVGFGLNHYKDQVLHASRMQASTTSEIVYPNEMESGTYIMDAKLHESALYFAVPLLIEAGFDYTRADIEDAIHLPIVPSDESDEALPGGIGSEGPLPLERNQVLEYLKQCLNGPRPLMCLCRNVLRKKIPRREIHRYVSSVTIPKKVQDYLLLRPLLQTLPDDM